MTQLFVTPWHKLPFFFFCPLFVSSSFKLILHGVCGVTLLWVGTALIAVSITEGAMINLVSIRLYVNDYVVAQVQRCSFLKWTYYSSYAVPVKHQQKNLCKSTRNGKRLIASMYLHYDMNHVIKAHVTLQCFSVSWCFLKLHSIWPFRAASVQRSQALTCFSFTQVFFLCHREWTSLMWPSNQTAQTISAEAPPTCSPTFCLQGSANQNKVT